MNASYLSVRTLRGAKVQMLLALIAGIVLTLFFGLAVVGALTDQSLREYLGLYIGLLVPSLAILSLGLRKRREIASAIRYDQIFANDRNGSITVYELKGQTGQEEEKIFRELEVLFRKAYFERCTLWRGEPRGVRIGDAAVNAQHGGFVTVRCRNCGASNRIRAGSRGKCEYCDAPLAGK